MQHSTHQLPHWLHFSTSNRTGIYFLFNLFTSISYNVLPYFTIYQHEDIRRIKVAELLLQNPLTPPTTTTTTSSSSSLSSSLSFEQSLQIDLPFLLPVLDPETAVLHNQRFQLAKAEYGPAVDSWLAYDILPPTTSYPSSSSSSNREMNIHWWNVIKAVLPSANIHINNNCSNYSDSHYVDGMLSELQLPDMVVSLSGRIYMLVQSKEVEWTHFLHPQAYKVWVCRCV